MKRLILFLLPIIFTLSLCSCSTTKTLYSWYGYDDAVHTFTKDRTPKSEEHLIKEYERLINTPNGTRKMVQPGICAEYGYLLIKQGKREEGLQLLKKEIELYPESKVFITRIIKQFEK